MLSAAGYWTKVHARARTRQCDATARRYLVPGFASLQHATRLRRAVIAGRNGVTKQLSERSHPGYAVQVRLATSPSLASVPLGQEVSLPSKLLCARPYVEPILLE